MIEEEEIKNIENISGNVRGEKFYTTLPYLQKREKNGEVKRVLEEMEKAGYPLSMKEINSNKMYPIKMAILLFVISKDVFNWNEEDIFEMGRFAPRTSYITKLLLRNLVSIKTIFNKAPDTWRNHYDFGSLEAIEINTEEKYLVVRVKDFNVHPITCPYHAGYFQAMTEFCVKSKEVKTVEKKCVHNGDDYHEYHISWK